MAAMSPHPKLHAPILTPSDKQISCDLQRRLHYATYKWIDQKCFVGSTVQKKLLSVNKRLQIFSTVRAACLCNIPLVCRKYAVSITCTDAGYSYV